MNETKSTIIAGSMIALVLVTGVIAGNIITKQSVQPAQTQPQIIYVNPDSSQAVSEDTDLGGTVYNRKIYFPAGINVGGVDVIDSSGNWDGAITGTSITTTGSSTLATVSSTYGYFEKLDVVSMTTTTADSWGVTGATTLSSTLAVTGASTFTGKITANGGILNTGDTGLVVASSTLGVVSVTSTLSVTGVLSGSSATLSSTLAVTGASTFTGKITANGGITSTGDTGLVVASSSLGVVVATSTLTIGSGGTAISKHLSGTATWDIASTVTGGTATTGIAISGATVGDTCLASIATSTAINPYFFNCTVTSTGSVLASFRNDSGHTLDFNSSTLRVDLWEH